MTDQSQKIRVLESASVAELRLLGKVEPALALAECLRREKREREEARAAMLAKDANDCLALMSALYSVIGQIVALNPELLKWEER